MLYVCSGVGADLGDEVVRHGRVLAAKVTHHPPDHAVEHGSHESRCDDD